MTDLLDSIYFYLTLREQGSVVHAVAFGFLLTGIGASIISYNHDYDGVHGRTLTFITTILTGLIVLTLVSGLHKPEAPYCLSKKIDLLNNIVSNESRNTIIDFSKYSADYPHYDLKTKKFSRLNYKKLELVKCSESEKFLIGEISRKFESSHFYDGKPI
jgi:hypothetical protein